MENQIIKSPKPFIKWAGGKRQLLPELLKYVPPTFKSYIEPFAGGAALFWEVGNRGSGPSIISDMNEALTITYRVVKSQVERLIPILAEMAKADSEAYFRSIRANFPKGLKKHLDIAAAFIYLNKTCFNGLYRVNQKGIFNVPYGKKRSVTICDADNLRACSQRLQDTVIEYVDFELALKEATEGDFVYLDPPYLPSSKTSNFTAFTKDGFTIDDHRRMVAHMAHLRNNGVKVLMSNSATTDIIELCKEHRLGMREVQARRAINSVGDLRGKVPEILVFNWDLDEAQMKLLLA